MIAVSFFLHILYMSASAFGCFPSICVHFRFSDCSPRYILASEPQTWPDYSPYIWPLPQSFTSGSQNISVNALGFVFQTNVSSADLNNSFARYQELMFPHLAVGTPPNAIDGIIVNVCPSSSISTDFDHENVIMMRPFVRSSSYLSGWQRVCAAAVVCR